jgi:thioredoxin-dependent peroxiredoxin
VVSNRRARVVPGGIRQRARRGQASSGREYRARLHVQCDLSQYEQKNAVILGVSVQSSHSHKEFCAKEELSFKLLADTNREVSSAYGSVMNLAVTKLSARHTFLINPEGVVVKEFLDVNPSKHSQEVLATLTQLQQSATAK